MHSLPSDVQAEHWDNLELRLLTRMEKVFEQSLSKQSKDFLTMLQQNGLHATSQHGGVIKWESHGQASEFSLDELLRPCAQEVHAQEAHAKDDREGIYSVSKVQFDESLDVQMNAGVDLPLHASPKFATETSAQTPGSSLTTHNSESSLRASQALMKVMTYDPDSCLQTRVQSTKFRVAVIFAIILQSATLGWEGHERVRMEIERLQATGVESQAFPQYFDELEWVFNAFFAVEWLVRLVAWKKRFFDRTDLEFFWWNMLDTFLILSSLLLIFDVSFTWVRSLRMFRIARVMRIFHLGKRLRKMVYALIRSVESIFWLLMLLSVLLYIFALAFMRGACFFLQEIDTAQYQDHMEDKAYHDVHIVITYFGTLKSTMVSLFASFTGGSEWDSILLPVMRTSPLQYLLGILFVITFVFAVMNVVTGVFVEDAMNITGVDESVAIANLIESDKAFEINVDRLMSIIDEDHDGILSHQEMMDALDKQSVRLWLRAHDIELNPDNAERLLGIWQKKNPGDFDRDSLRQMLQEIQGQARKADLVLVFDELMHEHEALRKIISLTNRNHKHIAQVERTISAEFLQSPELGRMSTRDAPLTRELPTEELPKSL